MIQPNAPTPRPSLSPEAQLRVSRILWAALSFACLMFVFVSFNSGNLPDWQRMWPEPSLSSGDPVAYQEAVFGLLCLMILVVSQLLPIRLLKRQAPLSGGKVGYGQVFIPLLLRLALTESIALFGFVLAMMSNNPAKIVPYALFALLRNLAAFPREDFFRAWADRAGVTWDATTPVPPPSNRYGRY
jgi:hypothetical protein